MLQVKIYDIGAAVLVIVILAIIKALFPSLADDNGDDGQPDPKKKQRNTAIQVGIALLLGLIFSYAAWIIAGLVMTFEAIFAAFLGGILTGASAMGLYDGKKVLRGS